MLEAIHGCVISAVDTFAVHIAYIDMHAVFRSVYDNGTVNDTYGQIVVYSRGYACKIGLCYIKEMAPGCSDIISL